MFTLKIILEVIAVLLLLVGYYYEDRVVAFERRLWKTLRGEFGVSQKPSKASVHSATYMASREASQRAFAEKERIAQSAAYARQQAGYAAETEDTRRVA